MNRNWIKKTGAVTLALILALALTGCTMTISFDQRYVKLDDDYVTDTVVPKEDPDTWKIVIDKLIFVNASNNVSIRVQPSDSPRIEAFYSKELRDYGFAITAEDGVINVSTSHYYTYSTDRFELVIYANFDELELKGGYKLDVDAAGMENVKLSIDGAADVEVENLESELIEINIAGAAAIKLSGNTDKLYADLNGAGDIDAKRLCAAVTEVEMDGAGSVAVSVTELLKVDIDGMGSVRYYGSPVVQRDIDGLGTVEQASKEPLASPGFI
jgi:hypothetical protein